MIRYILGGVGLTILGLKAKNYLSDEKNLDDINYALAKVEKWMCDADKKVMDFLGEEQKRPNKDFLDIYLIDKGFYNSTLKEFDKLEQVSQIGEIIEYLMNIKESISQEIDRLETMQPLKDFCIQEYANSKLDLIKIKIMIKDILKNIIDNDFFILSQFNYELEKIIQKFKSLSSFVAKEQL